MANKIVKRFREWRERNALNLTLVALTILLLVVALWNQIVIPVHSGNVGVKWSRFLGGTVTTRIYGEGTHVMIPWNIMYHYNVRLQRSVQVYDVLTEDGLRIEVEIAVRYRPVAEQVALLHKHFGPGYLEVLLIPEIGAHARAEIGQYSPQELYSGKREQIQLAILNQIREEVQVVHSTGEVNVMDFLYIEDVFIKSITLPAKVAEAIQSKLSQEQKMLEYDYILMKEEKERARKRIEAEGIKDFQSIVSEGISERYLKWKGIDATLALARSNNAKIVVIGGGEDGLPLILGPLDAGSGGTP